MLPFMVDMISWSGEYDKGVTFIKESILEVGMVIQQGDFVITQMEMDVAMPSGKTIKLDMSEWYEVKNGKIESVKIYYDAEEFRKELT